MTIQLHQQEYLPAGILDLTASRIHEKLAGPTLFHVTGRRRKPLFVAVLQHGNETTGWDAVRTLLKRYETRPLPRSVSLLIANVKAARKGVRHCSGEPDFNRSWPGAVGHENQFTAVTHQVVDTMAELAPIAAVDLHNNTGINPHYAAVNRLDHGYLQLARLFSRTVVYFTDPVGVLSLAFSPICPTAILECGQVGVSEALSHTIEYLDACLHMHQLPERAIAAHDLDLFHTLATVKLPLSATFSFDGTPGDFRFRHDLDHMNFRELPAGTLIGRVGSNSEHRLHAADVKRRDISDHVFSYERGEIRLKRAYMPSMFTLDKTVIHQDCFCYLMERVPEALWQRDRDPSDNLL